MSDLAYNFLTKLFGRSQEETAPPKSESPLERQVRENQAYAGSDEQYIFATVQCGGCDEVFTISSSRERDPDGRIAFISALGLLREHQKRNPRCRGHGIGGSNIT